jgi:hypothetical protein
MSAQSYIAKLKQEFPEFNIYGDPRQHYEKIVNSVGNTYYVLEQDLAQNNLLLYANINPNAGKVYWRVGILGNPPPSGEVFAVVLFKPETMPETNKVIKLPALAYRDVDVAHKELCMELGQCLLNKAGWFEFTPNIDLIKSRLLKKLVNIYAKRKNLLVFIGNFKIKYDEPVADLPSLEAVTGGLRTNASYTHNFNEILDIITLSPNIMPVGSFKYNVHKYPSDIDIFESFDMCCSIDTVKIAAKNAIQQIVLRVKSADHVYLGDFKAGEDARYKVDIGEWQADELLGYEVLNISSAITDLLDSKLILRDDYEVLHDLLHDDPTREEWDRLNEMLRDYKVLRWTSQEILQGFKILPGSEKILLESALAQNTLVKIDLWAKVNGRFMEVTNFFSINVLNEQGEKTASLTKELSDYAASLAADVRLYSSVEHRKTLKALKRLWSLSLFKNDLNLAGRISQLFGTSAAGLNQIVGEVETLSMMISQLPDPPLKEIIEQIDAFKPRIDQLSDNGEINQKLYEVIDRVVDPYFEQASTKYNAFQEALALLAEFQEALTSYVEELIYEEALSLGLEDPTRYLVD